jgi:hypothetical protein
MMQFFLVGGTHEERYAIAHQRGIDPQTIHLIIHPEDLYGFRGGELLIGETGSYDFLYDSLQIARRQNIKVPAFCEE